VRVRESRCSVTDNTNNLVRVAGQIESQVFSDRVQIAEVIARHGLVDEGYARAGLIVRGEETAGE
jgi:hypothetical protein